MTRRLFTFAVSAAFLAALMSGPLPGALPAAANEIDMPVAPSTSDAGTPGVASLALRLEGFDTVKVRTEATIESPFITLGDLFAGLPPAQADLPVDRAPAPGERVVLNAHALDELAARHDVNWQSSSRFERVLIHRRGYAVGRAEVEAALRPALRAAGMPAGAEIDIGAGGIHSVVGSAAEARASVRDVQLDPRTNRFQALVEVPTANLSTRAIRLSGSIHVLIDVPVLTRPVRRGMVVSEDDVIWDVARRGDLRPDVLLDPDDLIGMAARHGIQAGQPVRVSQVRKPQAVQRNGLVTMVLETPYLTVTARGRALEAGAVGDTVRVANMVSDKEVLAVVAGQNTVRVRPGMSTAQVY